MEELFNYRNKAQFPVGVDKEGNVVIGFYAKRTHSIIPMSTCYINDRTNEKILEVVKEFIVENNIKPYDEKTGKGLIRHIVTRIGYHTKEIMVCLVINADDMKQSLKDDLVSRLKEIPNMKSISLNINKANTNVIMGDKLLSLYGNLYITDYLGKTKFRISPLSFYQVNPRQTEKLYDLAMEYADLKGNEVVWDMYCGIGTISLYLASRAKKVYGVEIVPQAIEDAKLNASINNIENAEFYVGAAEEVVPTMYKKSNDRMKADVVVVDPPRKGCDEKLLDTLVKMEPERIVYVSCDPATLARDLKWLGENGYKTVKYRAVDQFGMTTHVETVCLLSRKDK
jgi:23S rRNA (uracil1939-C5)-methyltransferase